ncbi:monovalent cation/H+ antiporter subunit D family protein [Alkalicaulis satelles]|uniref:Monovalent cation/H+ antiporter subunit D family protein n=1 Tax=Alkalicaulis satelles TaxID=2609175 RepID=A0A5M6ZBW7_9PROT|nr:proton-conducting transporter membrane subunit [Alkalicaulis satelles]KAA5801640.1 monovalent cation/H+ antiporter subunit D family protein [Alkalicaulis satelles]
MSAAMLVPILLVLAPLVPALASALLSGRARARNAINIAFAAFKLGVVAYALAGVEAGAFYEWRIAFVPGLDMVLRLDALALLFVTLSAVLWMATTLYAIAYLKGSAHQARFFAFFNLCVVAASGIAMSGSLITFFVFYEILTLATWPLVVHTGSAKAMAAGRTYLAYTLAGSAALLAGIVWLESGSGPVEFAAGADLSAFSPLAASMIFVLLIGGLGAKTALIPLHAWLPAAMAAPAPVSALLHAVAVVKAGAFGVVRVIYDVYGIETVAALGLGLPLAALASATILYGSLQALRQSDIKKRLAYSTVSQVSYIVLGASLAGPFAVIGGLVHLVHQGLMKITLFFGAGVLAERAGVTDIRQLDGVGRRMPVTMAAFSIAALGMIGVPPVAGFVSKWYLAIGGYQSGASWVIAVLIVSSLLNAAYFLPLLYRAWLKPAAPGLPDRNALAASRTWLLIAPGAFTAAAALGAGLFAGFELSPLSWAALIAERIYLP